MHRNQQTPPHLLMQPDTQTPNKKTPSNNYVHVCIRVYVCMTGS